MSAAEGTLEQGLRIIRRRKFVFLQALVLVPLLALVLSLLQEKMYTAEATLLFRQSPLGLLAEGGSSSTIVDPSREAATNDELVTLPVVAEQAVQSLEEEEGITGIDVFGSVTVDSGGEADIATISATTPTPELSVQVANAYGEAFIEFRRESDQAQVQQGIDLINDSLDELSESALEGAQGQRLLDRLDRLETAQALQTGDAELVQPAAVPSSPSSPKTTRNFIIGLILGGALGLALAALLERIDSRIRTEEELEEVFGLPILARIPRTRLLAGGLLRNRDEMANSPELEAFRTLRVNLNYFSVDSGRRSILVTSPEPGDGKSTVARHLAMTMAEMGDDVVLVEADLHKGQAVSANGAQPGGGLSSVLTGVPLGMALIEVKTGTPIKRDGRKLVMLPSGAVPPNPSELLESDRMRTVLGDLHSRFDWVIIDSPALQVVSDALSLVPAVTNIVVVSGLGATTRDGARNFMKQLSILGAEPAGVVANFTKVERGGYSYYQRGAASKR